MIKSEFDVLKTKLQLVVLGLFSSCIKICTPKIHFQCKRFYKIIMPICDYGCEVWGFHKVPAIERIHLKFCNRIFHVRKSTAFFG